jgi:hypothetical protein
MKSVATLSFDLIPENYRKDIRAKLGIANKKENKRLSAIP